MLGAWCCQNWRCRPCKGPRKASVTEAAEASSMGDHRANWRGPRASLSSALVRNWHEIKPTRLGESEPNEFSKNCTTCREISFDSYHAGSQGAAINFFQTKEIDEIKILEQGFVHWSTTGSATYRNGHYRWDIISWVHRQRKRWMTKTSGLTWRHCHCMTMFSFFWRFNDVFFYIMYRPSFKEKQILCRYIFKTHNGVSGGSKRLL